MAPFATEMCHPRAACLGLIATQWMGHDSRCFGADNSNPHDSTELHLSHSMGLLSWDRDAAAEFRHSWQQLAKWPISGASRLGNCQAGSRG